MWSCRGIFSSFLMGIHNREVSMSEFNRTPEPLIGLLKVFPLLFVAGSAQGDMQQLDDSAMSRIQGQSGITLDMSLNMSAVRVAYYDDGQGVRMEGFRVGSSDGPGGGAIPKTRVGAGAGASLSLDYLVEDRRVELSGIGLAGAPGLSRGGVFCEQTREGTLRIRQGGGIG